MSIDFLAAQVQGDQVDRRSFVQVGAMAALAAGATAAAAADTAMDHSMHHGGPGPYAKLAGSASQCIVAGQTCLAHCIVLLGGGDTSIADCAKSVNQMLALCNALQSLATQGSATTPALAKVTLDVCTACEKECRKHEAKHAECKACADSCASCAKECKAVAA
jgi:Cys-rich four helix bundle protein (predicted Tat secretion target)